MTPRPRIQRAFLACLDESKGQLKREVRVGRRTDRFIEFGFDVGGSALRGSLGRDEIVVAAEEGGECWDFLLSHEVLPVRVAAGVVCGLCEGDEERVFASREALWRDHLFEPLGAWVNEELATATSLAMYREDGGTWAKLVRPHDSAAAATLAVALTLDAPAGEPEQRGFSLR